MVVHTETERVLETPALDHGVPPDQPSARLPGVRSGGRVLAADLLHEARPLRSADDRREGPQAQGRAARAARHPGRRALHPVLALRALLRRDHGHGRARHLQPGRPLGDRALPGHDARQQVLGQRRRHLPGGRAHRPRLPLPGARLVPRHAPSRSARAAPAAATSRSTPTAGAPHHNAGPAGGAAQAALQCRRQPVVDLRRGPLRLRLDRRRRPGSSARRCARAGHARRAQLGRGRGRGGGRRSGAAGPRRSASSPRPRCRTRTCSRCGGSPTRSASAHVGLPRAARACRATRTTS